MSKKNKVKNFGLLLLRVCLQRAFERSVLCELKTETTENIEKKRRATRLQHTSWGPETDTQCG